MGTKNGSIKPHPSIRCPDKALGTNLFYFQSFLPKINWNRHFSMANLLIFQWSYIVPKIRLFLSRRSHAMAWQRRIFTAIRRSNVEILLQQDSLRLLKAQGTPRMIRKGFHIFSDRDDRSEERPCPSSSAWGPLPARLGSLLILMFLTGSVKKWP